jgi:hypothetical protein
MLRIHILNTFKTFKRATSTRKKALVGKQISLSMGVASILEDGRDELYGAGD